MCRRKLKIYFDAAARNGVSLAQGALLNKRGPVFNEEETLWATV